MGLSRFDWEKRWRPRVRTWYLTLSDPSLVTTMATFRATRFLRGQYSRMMDLGGMPPAKTGQIRAVDGSKNLKVRAVAFDFELLTRSDGEKRNKIDFISNDAPDLYSSPVTVMVDKVKEIANLLNVDLGGNRDSRSEKVDHDDLSALIGEKAPAKSDIVKRSPLFSSDIRVKYADKLKSRGGLAGVDNAKRERENTIGTGDAASHMAARAAAVSQTAAETKWMALAGTGSLLSYISNRSMKIALLPVPREEDDSDESVGKRMKEFEKQLPNVFFDLLIDKGDNALYILKLMLKKLEMDPVATIVVSDRDDYLRAAKDTGMVTCRVRPMNAKRGSVTAHYNVETISEVQDVVNQINGISFQATLSNSKR